MKKHFLVICCLITSSAGAWAEPKAWSLDGNIGRLNQQAHGLAYQSGKAFEDFKWSIDDGLIAGGQIGFAAEPWLQLGIGGWSLLDGASSAEGYNTRDATQTVYRNNVAEHAYRLDAFAKVLMVDHPLLDISALGGFRREGSKWSAYGSRTTGSSVVVFPDGTLKATYEQSWNMPYFGIAADYVNGPWQIGAAIFGSPAVHGQDENYQTNEDVMYVTKFKKTSMLGAKLDAAYDLGGGVFWTMNADYQRIAETKGTTDIYLPTGVFGWPSGFASGAKSQSLALNTGVSIDLCGCRGNRQGLADSGPFRLEGYVGHLSAEAGEYVYDNGKLLSQLDWQVHHALIVGGMLHYDVNDWLTLSGGGWTLASANNTMDDFDWLDDTRTDWSDWSHHKDTRSDYGYQLDLAAKARIGEWKENDLYLIGGYRQTGMKWSAYGGSYVYSRGGFRNDVGNFIDGSLGITYEQTWHIPYAGISATRNHGPWLLTGTLYASPYVTGNDEDLHAKRKLTFNETFDETTMIGTQLGASYEMTERSRLSLQADYQRIASTKADTLVRSLETGQTEYFGMGAAGASYRSMTISAGLDVRF